jgi:hypothetical protein
LVLLDRLPILACNTTRLDLPPLLLLLLLLLQCVPVCALPERIWIRNGGCCTHVKAM